MSLTRTCVLKLIQCTKPSLYRIGQLPKLGTSTMAVRQFTLTTCRLCQSEPVKKRKDAREGNKGHTIQEISVQESIKYMESEAFKLIYGKDPVWKHYRRNFKGHFAPKPRVSCQNKGVLTSASPCPLCRDDYLVVSYKNTTLLKQFVSELTGETLDPKMTGLCMKQYKQLKLEVARAQDHGLLEKAFHFRKYDYNYFTRIAEQRRLTTDASNEPEAEDSELTMNEVVGTGRDNVGAASNDEIVSEIDDLSYTEAETGHEQETSANRMINRKAMHIQSKFFEQIDSAKSAPRKK